MSTKKLLLLFSALVTVLAGKAQTQEQSIADFKAYDFLSGDKTIFDDPLSGSKNGSLPANWILDGGSITIDSVGSSKCISVLEYYTKMRPKLKPNSLPATFTIEFDTWLDPGYDGNPGIELQLQASEENFCHITPNRDNIYCRYPEGETAVPTPEEIRGEKYYSKWNHIAVMYSKRSLSIYVNQFKVIYLPDCGIVPKTILLTGNRAMEMKMLFKNFRIATEVPTNIAADLATGKFVTHGIRFESNRSTLRAESMGVINQIATYLKANPTVRIQITGHTDADGDDLANQKLSEARSETVRQQLIQSGVLGNRLLTKGMGESQPIDSNATIEGKANNRRVEFTKIPN